MAAADRPTAVLGFADLLIAGRRGDGPALGALLKTYERVLLHEARREVPADLQAKGGASDLVQDTFLKAQRLFPRFLGGTEPELQAWLRRLLRQNFANF